ncbi:plasmid stabilization system (plasmid) [Dinoroseobacter shibae DFL 12 = DSM 16493]|jgi:toxin ParE1/3/4|uniref:Toxin n=1 Tax=Dinoroseobacter shibae (strain DSM 16493 / NCIMB 14021 / DFL 12) TaxID=398580 RepID=A8LU92_DINSH|nr:type II toxin-antitoxin system RelE/ParE family toxin [Dinoroseobacter shibae]ABV95809.1 plasmid stabilization system [Dinoroseobacter shibae DFL 12 = DSM 16493]URF49122.1 type II toxin-antitoxin system RelE/ParE family toxin [Dinoroseobacter shibae]URF53431.1 type II toxin-antitoxin system RelE/ParE family toxin [Dinoroseobacter shibae]
MGTYRLSEEAKDDLIGIHQYGVRKHGEAQADAYFWQIIERLEVLGETPLLYQEVPEIREGYRRSVCGKHSIYYTLDGDDVEIMAILRSQDPTLRFGR